MDDKLKALAEAIVVEFYFNGIVPSYRAYHDEGEEMEAELNRIVQNIAINFEEILRKEIK